MKRLESSERLLADLQELGLTEGGRRLARLLFGGSSVLYACRPDGDFGATFVSPNVERVFGWRPTDFTGDPRFRLNHVHPDDLGHVQATLQRLAETDHLTYEYRLRHADGCWRWVRDELFVWRDAEGRAYEITGAFADISEARESRQALEDGDRRLRQTQRRLEDAIESLDDAFSLYDADDRLVMCNSRYGEIYPLVADEMRPGVRFVDLIRMSAERGQHNLDGLTVEEWVALRLACHRAGGRIYQQLSDGRHLDIREQRTSDGGTVGIRRDVTETRTMEAALREALAFEQALIDAVPIPVFFKLPNGRYQAVNKAFEEAHGVRREDILGRTAFDFMPHEYAEATQASDDALLAAGGRQRFEMRMVLSDGREHHLLVNKAVFHDPDGRLRGWVGSLVDVTEVRRTEERLLQAAKLATLGQIASEIAHELNQPLSIMRMTLDNLRDQMAHGPAGLSGMATEPLRMAARQVERMADIVNHLRVYSRAESQDARLFSPVEAVANAARLVAPQLEAAGIELRLECPSGCAAALGKASYFEQVILNLLSNARDAVLGRRAIGMPGRIAIRLEEQPLDRTIRVVVEDNGGGIPDPLWDSIYEPFFTTKEEGRGTGLGLSISSDIMRQLGGSLSGENIGSGARFSLVLPAQSTRCDTPSAAAAATAQPPAPRLRVLVVDDEPEALQCMADFLRRRGHRVTVAGDGQEGLRLFAAEPCDVLVSDLRMPHLSGAELARRLRALRPGLPVVLMTGQVDVTAADMEREGFMLVRKPISLKQLNELILNLGGRDG